MTGNVLHRRRGSSAELNNWPSFPSLTNIHMHSLHSFPLSALSLTPCLPVIVVGGIFPFPYQHPHALPSFIPLYLYFSLTPCLPVVVVGGFIDNQTVGAAFLAALRHGARHAVGPIVRCGRRDTITSLAAGLTHDIEREWCLGGLELVGLSSMEGGGAGVWKLRKSSYDDQRRGILPRDMYPRRRGQMARVWLEAAGEDGT